MELALYTPGQGYYERERTIGKTGDFYTNVSVGALFGRLLASQFARWIGPPDAQTVIAEAGAHDGQLAFDILTGFREEFQEPISYYIVEPSLDRQSRQRRKLEGFPVTWFEEWQEVPPIKGVIFSNELLDAMPVRRFAWNKAQEQWNEWLVDCVDGQFVWARGRPVDPADCWIPGALWNELPDGFACEASAAAIDWWTSAARCLSDGRLMAIDYGYTETEWMAKGRPTVRAYESHHLSDEILKDPGAKDLTAHVNFSAIIRAGESAGLNTEGLQGQSAFLLNAICRLVTEGEDVPPALKRQLQTLTHPDYLGRAFRVLVQRKVPSLPG